MISSCSGSAPGQMLPVAYPLFGAVRRGQLGLGFSGVRLHGRNPEPLMSALGHKRTLRRFHPMSALPPKADIHHSFDHMVGAGQQHWRNLEAERFGGHEVNAKIEDGREYDRQIGRAFTLQDTTGIYAELPIIV